jgi:DNA-binding CsgD family transcriptional regulator
VEIFRFIELSNETKSLERIFDLLIEAASSEGFDRAAYGSVNYRERLRQADHIPQAIIHNYSREWHKSYVERKDWEIDPVLLFAPQMVRAFPWKDFFERNLISKHQGTFLRMAEDAGLRDGVSVPIHSAGGKVSVISFAASESGTVSSAQKRRLEVLASQFHIAFADLSNNSLMTGEIVSISHRERDCLSWTAEGKSSWDISTILNISESTVNFHIKNAMRKLQTKSRTVAVIRAIRQGIIDCPSYSNIK